MLVNLPPGCPEPSISLVDSQTVQVTAPNELIRALLLPELQTHSGRHKDTDFQRIDLHSFDANLIEGGARVNASWNVYLREQLAGLFGKSYYTPWAHFSGTLEQDIAFSVVNNEIEVEPTRNHISSNSDWIRYLIEIFGPMFNANGRLREGIENALKPFNKVNLVGLLKTTFSSQLRQATGLNQEVLDKILDPQLISLNLRSTGNALILTLKLEPSTGVSFS